MKEMPCCLESGPSLTGTVTGMGIGKAAGRRQRSKKRGGNEMESESLMISTKV